MESKSYIHDPVHGHIFLTDIERWTIDTLEFQRLRFIRQNSLLHYVFPGAFHTRFAHSLGVCHVASRITKRLIHWVNEPEIYYPVQVYRLACLLHDVGHGAFSHTLSYVKIFNRPFLPTLNEVLTHLEDWGLNKESPIFKTLSERDPNQCVEHEELSLLIINRIFQEAPEELLEGVDRDHIIQDICSMIDRDIPPTDHFLSLSRELFTGALKSIPCLQNDDSSEACIADSSSFHRVLSSLVSGTIDADRMDYLLRDSQTFGVNYGLFDFEGILSSLTLVIDQGKFHLGLNSKRINTLDDFLWSRYQMFNQIYCHKTHVGYNLLLNESMQELVANDKLKVPTSLDEYLYLTDDYVMGKVFHQAQKYPNAKGAIQNFAHRKLPQFLGVFEASVDDPIWNKSVQEVYQKTDFDKFENWQEDKKLKVSYMKAEVIKGKEARMPLTFSFDKQNKKYIKDNYFNKSVYFNPLQKSEEGEKELSARLNKKLIYFFK